MRSTSLSGCWSNSAASASVTARTTIGPPPRSRMPRVLGSPARGRGPLVPRGGVGPICTPLATATDALVFGPGIGTVGSAGEAVGRLAPWCGRLPAGPADLTWRLAGCLVPVSTIPVMLRRITSPNTRSAMRSSQRHVLDSATTTRDVISTFPRTSYAFWFSSWQSEHEPRRAAGHLRQVPAWPARTSERRWLAFAAWRGSGRAGRRSGVADGPSSLAARSNAVGAAEGNART